MKLINCDRNGSGSEPDSGDFPEGLVFFIIVMVMMMTGEDDAKQDEQRLKAVNLFLAARILYLPIWRTYFRKTHDS